MMTYHYCARYADPDTGAVTHLDGIMTSEVAIDSQEAYWAAKKAIDPDNHKRLTILSLTPLPEEYKRGEFH